jgi:hypothetical protein
VTVFQHTWEKVLSGEKTQTRRLWKQYEILLRDYWTVEGGQDRVIQASDPNISTRTIWQVGKDYAIQPGRGKKSVGRFVVTALRDHEDVRNISDIDVRAEGFDSKWAFLQTWTAMRDPSAHWCFDAQRVDYWINTGKRRELVGWETVQEIIAGRPVEHYKAWPITFKLCEVQR